MPLCGRGDASVRPLLPVALARVSFGRDDDEEEDDDDDDDIVDTDARIVVLVPSIHRRRFYLLVSPCNQPYG